jgi:chromosome segregation ATPase
MSNNMTYAQALTEAKQMLVQQQLRIKADAEKIRAQQQTIVDQSTQMADMDKRSKEQASEMQRLITEAESLSTRVQEATTAREQAEAVIDRQGQRLTQLQEQQAGMEKRIAEQSDEIIKLIAQLDIARSQLPSSEDQEALAAMSDLLARKNAAAARKTGPTMMRLTDDPAIESNDSFQQAQAA